MIKNSLRKIKRQLLYGGYAEPVYNFISEMQKGRNSETELFHKKGSFVVNLSFDLEFALNTRFWSGEYDKALYYGNLGRENLRPIIEYMFNEKIPYNVQIVAALLKHELLKSLPFNEEQNKFVENNAGLFALSEKDIRTIEKGYVEVGLHGLSHKSFSDLTREDAVNELISAQEVFAEKFGKKSEFMSFPKNDVHHTDVLQQNNIKCWRSRSQDISKTSIPLGVWFSPGILDEKSLEKLLRKIKEDNEGYFLHLWGHFTEMNLETFKVLIDVIKKNGWSIETVREYTDRYG